MTDPKKQADETLGSMSSEKKQDILSSFDKFQNYLKDKINKGEKVGLSEEQLAKGAERVAEYLKNHEDPKNTEEKLLQEMWKVSDDDQKHQLAHVLVKLAREEGN